jgi:enoyl-CoA hydratase/carnithine racemase
MSSAQDILRYDQHQHVVVLCLHDPTTRNALSGEAMFSAFESAAKRINADIDVRCVILTGAGTSFCSGGNVTDMRERKGMFGGAPHDIAVQYRAGIQRVTRAMFEIEVPTIAAVNGPAIGAGCGLACICDMRIASDKAAFAESFVKLGIVPGDGSAWSLPRIVGYARAAELSFTGETLDAAAALASGLVSKVVSADQLLNEALALAARIASNPPHVLRWTKRMLREAQHSRLESVLDFAAAHQALAHHTADHAEAVAALFERRAPIFQGR